MIVISTGCPASIGPEVSVRAALDYVARAAGLSGIVLVGDEETLFQAADLVGARRSSFTRFQGEADPGRVQILPAGPTLRAGDRRAGRPNKTSGAAQLAYVNAAYDLVRGGAGRALVTAAVSKAAVHSSGAPGAKRFLGHTEWLRDRDRASHTTMCFTAATWATGLVTTHLPISRVPARISAAAVARTTIDVARLLQALGTLRPRVAVCSLNPHAGEDELLGKEEGRAIVPGIGQARRTLGRGASITGPIGAETAYRKAHAGDYDGVVAMYHDQATIPTKLIAFGTAVNVTMGLSIVRTSVDHGTAYDIAWQGVAESSGMLAAIEMAERLKRGWKRASNSRSRRSNAE